MALADWKSFGKVCAKHPELLGERLQRQCVGCRKEYYEKWNEKNHEKIKAAKRLYWAATAHKRIPKPRTPAVTGEARRLRILRASTKWQRSHKEKVAANTMRRMARKLNATPKWANEFFVSEAYHLAKLRTQATGYPWHVDHIVPLRSPLVCGLHVENNLRVIPAKANMLKGNRLWPDMPGSD